MSAQAQDSNKQRARLLWISAGVSVVAWLAFLLFFRFLWPIHKEGGELILPVTLWLVLGAVGTQLAVMVYFRAVQMPKAWQLLNCAMVFVPALILDVFATVAMGLWFPEADGVHARMYPALIIAAAGVSFGYYALTAPPTSK